MRGLGTSAWMASMASAKWDAEMSLGMKLTRRWWEVRTEVW